jgi:hypothetical protein
MSLQTGVRWKDVATSSSLYTFLGLQWNHRSKTISLSEKMISKLLDSRKKVESCVLTSGELESLSGRLVYCCGALQIPPNPFYKVAKAVRHCLRRAASRSVVASLSPWLRSNIVRWIDLLMAVPRPFKLLEDSREAWLFSDASLIGYGAILMSSDGRINILGHKWSDGPYTSGDMAFLEALAVSNAVESF